MKDDLIDLYEERLSTLDALMRKKNIIIKTYKKKVKPKVSSVGDYVLKVILPLEKKDRTLGKWSPNWEGPFRVNQVFSNNTYEVEELNSDNQKL